MTRAGERAPEAHVDVVVVGAGLSGIGAAHHLQAAFPGRSYLVLEARGDLGGTWDLFRYPGIRSDSDMQTLGYRFRPWAEAKAIADGPAIREYIRDTAREAGIDAHIRFGVRVVGARWSTPEARWHVTARRAGDPELVTFTCAFLHVCSGYYDYEGGHVPDFPGLERFAGEVVHPQAWPPGLVLAGRRVVVIGSGATAVTLVPALAGRAAHVTMLQRSPSYVVSLPSRDKVADLLRAVLPPGPAYALTRWKNVVLQTLEFQLSRRRPALVKRLIRRGVERRLPPGFDVATHFTPTYDPWDQRTCLVPDGDLFRVLGDGSASIVTDHVATFSERGVVLRSGGELEADVVVTATGLNLLALGGIELVVDGRPVAIPETMVYKGTMLAGVPNLAFTVGYTNLSWTLKADLAAEFACRVLAHMDATGTAIAVARATDPSITERPLLDFKAGYVQRGLHRFPLQGSRPPWRLRQTYPQDLLALRHGRIDDGVLRFTPRVA